MKRSDFEVASRLGQGVIAAYDPSLAIDGKWGRFTAKAYDALPRERQQLVDTVLRSVNTSASELIAYRSKEREKAVIMKTDYDGTVDKAIRLAAADTGVSESLLRGFVFIESNFNPKAVNGSSRGLMQMQPGAWTDARAERPSLPSYDAVFDPLQNALAGAVYLKINSRRLSKIPGFTETPDAGMLYLAHQQGAGGFAELWNAAQGRKTTSYVTERAMRGNPPQDGRGATTNKAEFYTRWLEVARRKIKAAGY